MNELEKCQIRIVFSCCGTRRGQVVGSRKAFIICNTLHMVKQKKEKNISLHVTHKGRQPTWQQKKEQYRENKQKVNCAQPTKSTTPTQKSHTTTHQKALKDYVNLEKAPRQQDGWLDGCSVKSSLTFSNILAAAATTTT